MMKKTSFFIATLVVIALAWLTACERILSGTEKAAVLAFSESITDNLFAGLTSNDYAAFSRDFDTDMQAEISATSFVTWKQDIDDKLGGYLSRRIDQVTQADEFYVVVYQAKFEQDNLVMVEMAFHASDQSIAQFSFDSEKFLWSAFDYGQ